MCIYMYIYTHSVVYIHTHYEYIYTHTMKYYLAIKQNEIMLFAATWMDLKIITPSEASQRKACFI